MDKLEIASAMFLMLYQAAKEKTVDYLHQLKEENDCQNA